ncbi:MAG TPA: type II toxin-antitoxin system VapC family toxin [Candidatus Acidoferrales bacterium]|nr:type II toxin-antitoxin system VapC family toxin [Candidatus Acidoferrales bacterium]
MILDSSAALAVLLDEPERAAFRDQIVSARRRIMSSVTFLEAAIALFAKRGEAALAELDVWVEAADIEVVPFTAEHARIARRAYVVYGKRSHPAALNFGDCASYALAVAEGEPLLYKGDDFRQTNVESAL